MMFSNVLDAQTQLVSFIVQRYNLHEQYITYNDTNDPTKSIRTGIKNSIKPIQSSIDASNAYLVANNTLPLIYKSTLVNAQGLVTTQWANEYQVPGTQSYILAQTPGPTQTDLQTSLDGINSSILQVSAILNQQTQMLEDANALDDSVAYKTDLIKSATNAVVSTSTTLNGLTQSKSNITDLMTTNSTPTPPTDLFSQNIQSTLNTLISQKAGYNQSLNDQQAILLMRRKILDDYYTATTTYDKQVALNRLNAASQKMLNPAIPIVRNNYNFDPNAFTTLNEQLNTIDAQIVIASNNNDQVTLNDLLAQKQELVDTLLGFRDAPYGNTIAYDPPPGIVIANQNPVPTPSTNTPGSTDSSAQESQAIINQVNQKQNSANLIPPGEYLNVNTSNYVQANNVPATQSGTIINVRPANEQTEQAQADAGYLTTYNNSVADAEQNNNNLNANYAAQQAALQTQIDQYKTVGAYDPSYPQAQAQIADLTQQQAQLSVKQSQDPKYTDPTQAIDAARNQYQYASGARATQTAIAQQIINTPASLSQAQSIAQTYQDTTDASNSAQISFNKTYDLAIANARQNQSPNPNDPSTWSDADRAAVASAQDNVNTTRISETNAAIAYNAYATDVPDGNKTLLAAGYTQQQIDATNQQALLTRNNNVTTPNYTDVQQAGLTASGTQLQFQGLQPTGFEGINGGAPFYMQFPTKQAITDFHLVNGIGPYGNTIPTDMARNAIHFNIFEIIPPPAKAQLVPGTSGLVQNVVDSANSNTIGSFTIYPSEQELQIKHNHNYSGGPIGDLLTTLTSALNTGESLLSVGAAVTKSIQAGKQVGIPNQLVHRIETVDKYNSTDKQEMTTNFLLFTKSDFLDDIFRPLMFLTALSYPKREIYGNGGLNLAIVGKGVANAASALGAGQSAADQIGNASQAAGNAYNNIVQNAASQNGAGPFRYYITQNPEYISVRHASGLFYLPLAVITNVSYEFTGPWYNYAGEQIATGNLIDQALSNALNTAAQAEANAIFADVQSFFTGQKPNNPSTNTSNQNTLANHPTSSNDPLFQKYKLPYAYPSIARCSISYKAALPLFRDDYLALYNSAGTPNVANGSTVVSVTEKQTGTVNQQLNRVF